MQAGGTFCFCMQDALRVCGAQVVEGIMTCGRKACKRDKFEPPSQDMFAAPAKSIKNAVPGQPPRPLFFGLTAIDPTRLSIADFGTLENDKMSTTEWAEFLEAAARRFDDAERGGGSQFASGGSAGLSEEDDEFSASSASQVSLGEYSFEQVTFPDPFDLDAALKLP